MNKGKSFYWVDIVSLLFFTFLSIAAIAMKEITIFYVIYVFWWDELMKTVFDLFRYIFKKEEITNQLEYKAAIGSRFFMLFIYFVFIVICFGFIIEWDTRDSVSKNVGILLFQNVYFNISLISFTAREMYVYSNKSRDLNQSLQNIMSKGIITLHVSIILGLLLWAVATKKLGSIPIQIEQYSSVLSIMPFLLIKFLFEWSEIKSKRKALNKEIL